MRITIIFFLFILVFTSCKTKDDVPILTIDVKNAKGYKLLVHSVPYPNEIADTLILEDINEMQQQFLVQLPEEEERLYRIRVQGSRVDFVIINDGNPTEVSVNIAFPKKYTVSGSPATTNLHNFLNQHDSLWKAMMVELNDTSTGHLKPGMGPRFAEEQRKAMMRPKLYADTVSSAGAFLYASTLFELGNDSTVLKEFILNARKRFSGHPGIEKWLAANERVMDIYRIEYTEGQKLPVFSLPDSSGKMISNADFLGKYLYIDFWPTWCGECVAYDEKKAQAIRMYRNKNFEILSVAMDGGTNVWRTYFLRQKHNTWKNVIDTLLWEGPAVNTIKYDTVPYNILVSPEGTILDRAIHKDSLLHVLRRHIK